MNKLQRLVGGASLMIALATGCSDDDDLVGKPAVSAAAPQAPATVTEGEVVNAGTPQEIPGKPIAARFWLEADPTKGEIWAYEIHPGNVIHRDTGISLTTGELRYNQTQTATRDTPGCTPGATCVPPASRVRLSTPANTVTFVDSMGSCTSNGGTCDGMGGRAPAPVAAPCSSTNTFCFDTSVVSKYAFPLPNTVLRFFNPGSGATQCNSPPATPILGCQPNSTSIAHGLCTFAQDVPIIDDAGETMLASCIPGDGVTNYPCNYCVGNGGTIAGMGGAMDGLKYALVQNQDNTTADAALKAINTVKVALKLSGSTSFAVGVEIRYTAPGLNPVGHLILDDGGSTPMCLTPGTTDVYIDGGGFGPPSACHGAQPLAGCPIDETSANAPRAGYSISLGGVAIPNGNYLYWSDRLVAGKAPMGVSGTTLQASVITPAGTVSTTETFNVCAGGPNTWRTFAGNTISLVQPAAVAIGTTIYVAGGRSSASTLTTGTTTVSSFTVPTTMDTTITVASTGVPLPAARSGAGYTVAGGRFYVIGGNTNTAAPPTSTCANTVYSWAPGDGAWTTLTALPAVRCTPTAFTVGQYIYVTGGTTTRGGTTLVAGTLRLDTANLAGGWTSLTVGDDVPATPRFGAAGAVSGGGLALLIGGHTGGGVSALVDALTDAAGDPAFAASTSIGSALMFSGAASANAFFYTSGGQAATGTAAGVTTLQRIDNTTPGMSWATAPPAAAPQARSQHALVAAQCMGCTAQKLYAIGGQSSGVVVSTVDEYTE